MVLGIRGFSAAAIALKPREQTEALLKKIQRIVKVKTKTANAGTKVLKFQDAIDCVETVCNAQYGSSFASALAGIFIADLNPFAPPGEADNGAQILAQAIVDCMEEFLLEQARRKVGIRVSPPGKRGRPKKGQEPPKNSYYAQRRGGAGSQF